MPLLAYVSYKRRGVVTAHFCQESQYTDRKVNLSKRLRQYLANIFSNVIDREATQVLYRACTQAIILATHKITWGKKGQEEKIFQCYIIQGVGMLNVMITMMIYHIAPNFCGLEYS